MRQLFFAVPMLCSLIAACASGPVGVRPPVVTVETVEPWRSVASLSDATQIDALPGVWTRVVGRLQPRRARLVAAEGPLLVPGAALEFPQVPPGSYSCRVIRIGTAQVRSFPANFCYVRAEPDGMLTLTKQTGSDLPAGHLYPAGDKRYVFLGARQVRAGDNSIAYGQERDRDVVGVVERVGAFRWRLVTPSRDGAVLDVLEMTPVPTDRQPE